MFISTSSSYLLIVVIYLFHEQHSKSNNDVDTLLDIRFKSLYDNFFVISIFFNCLFNNSIKILLLIVYKKFFSLNHTFAIYLIPDVTGIPACNALG